MIEGQIMDQFSAAIKHRESLQVGDTKDVIYRGDNPFSHKRGELTVLSDDLIGIDDKKDRTFVFFADEINEIKPTYYPEKDNIGIDAYVVYIKEN